MGDAPSIQLAPISRPTIITRSHEAEPRPVRIQPGQQAGSRRTTAATVVELAEPQAAGGQCIHIRRLNLAAIASDI